MKLLYCSLCDLEFCLVHHYLKCISLRTTHRVYILPKTFFDKIVQQQSEQNLLPSLTDPNASWPLCGLT